MALFARGGLLFVIKNPTYGPLWLLGGGKLHNIAHTFFANNAGIIESTSGLARPSLSGNVAVSPLHVPGNTFPFLLSFLFVCSQNKREKETAAILFPPQNGALNKKLKMETKRKQRKKRPNRSTYASIAYYKRNIGGRTFKKRYFFHSKTEEQHKSGKTERTTHEVGHGFESRLGSQRC